uniref:Uncharacterized protein n=1 Tax=viral metagenome TaxID=1070528 RepID=A0A6M3JLL0_9ZZZZ
MTYQERLDEIVGEYTLQGVESDLAALCRELIVELEKSEKAIAGLGKLISQKDVDVPFTEEYLGSPD